MRLASFFMKTQEVEFGSRPALSTLKREYKLLSFKVIDGVINSYGITGKIIHNLQVRFLSCKSHVNLTMSHDDAFLLAIELLKVTAPKKSAHEVMQEINQIFQEEHADQED